MWQVWEVPHDLPACGKADGGSPFKALEFLPPYSATCIGVLLACVYRHWMLYSQPLHCDSQKYTTDAVSRGMLVHKITTACHTDLARHPGPRKVKSCGYGRRRTQGFPLPRWIQPRMH